MSYSISVVIPTLNEADCIEQAIASIRQHHDDPSRLDIIIADGGSGDPTVDKALGCGVRVIQAPLGRAHQMNAGAEIATGEILLFLHADTKLPPQFATHITEVLGRPRAIAGAFELQIDGSDRRLRWVEWGVKWRSRLNQMPYGDQALFMRSEIFHQVGGFPPLPILEDVEMVKRLKRIGRIYIAPAAVRTSARRWQRLGIVRTTLLNQLVLLAFWLGVPTDRIAYWYRTAPKRWGRSR
ncbi:MAG: TIGR04283 family arsenosugar biosynthesis glycosyltransferase [Synechococcales cyanobacterium T60_A2020_003]|nr:TIGR04283 family arsenosugar biosynthesis glycosyltransferase [Synechococcales cyanobacterium T60_A2020_003]